MAYRSMGTWKLRIILVLALCVVVSLVMFAFPEDMLSNSAWNQYTVHSFRPRTNRIIPAPPYLTRYIEPDRPPTEWEETLHRDFALAILTTKTYRHRMQWALKSWLQPKVFPIVDVLSDDTNATFVNTEGEIMTIPNYIKTGCSDSYLEGLCCKNHWMLKNWKENPKYKNVKWFYRGMDDSWVHLQNMVWLAQQYDHTKPMVIGEKLCTPNTPSYLDGGPGFLISRAVLDHPQYLSAWNESYIDKRGRMLDDWSWGIYAEKVGITVVHYHGITHASLFNTSGLFLYYLRQRGLPWPTTYRPVAYHQLEQWLSYMPAVHAALVDIDYGRPHPDPYTPPTCSCVTHHHGRCSYSYRAWEYTPCNNAYAELICIGAGPWPNQGDILPFHQVLPKKKKKKKKKNPVDPNCKNGPKCEEE